MDYISSLPPELLNLLSKDLDKESFVNFHAVSSGMYNSLSPTLYLENHPQIISDLVNQSEANFDRIPSFWKTPLKEAATTELKLRHYKVLPRMSYIFEIFTDITKLDTLGILTIGNYVSYINYLKKLTSLKVQKVPKEFFTSIQDRLVDLEIKDVKAMGCEDGSWPKLESLIITNEHQDQDFVEIQGLSKLKSLKKLRISSENLNIEKLNLEQMPNLEYVQLETILCEINSLEKVLQLLTQVPSLKKIDLKLKIDNSIDEKSLNLIKKLAGMGQLGYVQLKINPKGNYSNCLDLLFIYLSKHINVIQIETNHFNHNKSSFNSTLRVLHDTALPSLTTLFLESHLLTREQLKGICEAHSGIRSLSLEKCTLNPLDLFPICNLKLEKLNLALTKTNDEILKMVGDHLPALKLLSLRGCKTISDEGLKNLITLTHLKGLDLMSTSITDESVSFIESKLPHLRKLNLHDTHITKSSLSKLTNMKQLQRIALNPSQSLPLESICDSPLNLIQYFRSHLII